MECVTTVRYSVHFNGSSLGYFTPTRGLRQGDPLSPYLFLFVADGLSTIIQNQVRCGELEELKICRRAPGVSHLLFADDTLLFFKGEEEQGRVVQRIISMYERCTGQMVSHSKCSMMFGSGCSSEAKKELLQIMNIQKEALEERYLGLPTPEGRMSKARFKSVKEKLAKPFDNWSEKYMSMGAKEVLIKSVAQAIPTYIMGVFKFTGHTV